MTHKVRVHELAEQLGITSKELLATLKAQGGMWGPVTRKVALSGI